MLASQKNIKMVGRVGADESGVKPPHSKSGLGAREGFTLIEVVCALAILMLFLVPILGSVSNGLRSVKSAEYRSLALRLAQDRMAEIEMLPFPDTEGTENGDFGDEYPEYEWEMEMIKTPELLLMEEYIKRNFEAMEIHLKVTWNEAGVSKSIVVNTILMSE